MDSQQPRGHQRRLHSNSATTLSRLDATPASVGVARAQVVRFCRRNGLADLAETAALLTSELVTNAVQHGVGPLTMSISRVPGELRVGVSDNSTDPPRPQGQPPPDQPHGRGLFLVDALATSWRYLPNPGGKTVSFTLTTAPEESAPAKLRAAGRAAG